MHCQHYQQKHIREKFLQKLNEDKKIEEIICSKIEKRFLSDAL